MLDAKNAKELVCWDEELRNRIVPWYRGEIPKLWGRPCPSSPGTGTVADAAMAFRQADVKRYQELLQMPPDRDYGMILEIGCGPLVPAACFTGLCFGVDPLIAHYRALGYPVDRYGAVLLNSPAEDLWMLPDDLFDTIVSQNSIDHVDDFEAVCSEMCRLAKPGALIRHDVTYRKATITEPQELDDDRVMAAMGSFPIQRLREIMCPDVNYVLWGTAL